MEENRHIETPRGAVGSKRPRIDPRNGQLNSGSGQSSGSNSGSSSKSSLIQSTMRYNPFRNHILPKLSGPIWSPRTMDCPVETPPQTRWNIDQMSKLHPVNIEESPSSHHITEPLEPEEEDKAQADSQLFFDSHHLPSPVTNNSGSDFSLIKRKVDKCIGTDLSLPWNLPIEVMELLESYSQGRKEAKHDDNGNEWGANNERKSSFMDPETETLLNTSSNLRRKLEFSFDHLEDSMRSDESDIEERRYHGALVISP